MEAATRLCLTAALGPSQPVGISCPSQPGKTFRVDFLAAGQAYEIKWRDATTDGDHVAKEKRRLQAVVAAGYRPVRLMFFVPQRRPAQAIQRQLAELYAGCGGRCLSGPAAWQHIRELAGFDLQATLAELAAQTPALANLRLRP